MELDAKDITLIKQFKTVVTCSAFLGLGICRTLQGPSMLDLLEQTHLSTSEFQWVYTLCAISFPVGNIAGLLIDRCPPYLFMAAVSLFLGIFFALIPWAEGLYTLCAYSGFAEFFMGLIDTATNVSILRLWSDNHKRAIYFNCLHFSFGLGNFLGPVIAEAILGSKTSTSPTNSTIIQSAIDPIEYDFGFLGNSFTNLQEIHIVVTAFLMMITMFFTICHCLPRTNEDKIEGHQDKKPLDKYSLKLKVGFVLVLAVLVFIANGINFAYGNFISTFAVYSNLQLDKAQGARAASNFWGCSLGMKLLCIWLLRTFKQSHILFFNITILMVASVMLVISGQDNWVIFIIGTSMAGIGISTIFSLGVPWAKDQCIFHENILILMTSIGAQVIKIPVAAKIEENPMILMEILLGCSATIILLAVMANAMVLIAEHKMRNDSNHNTIENPEQVEAELKLTDLKKINIESDDEELPEKTTLTS